MARRMRELDWSQTPLGPVEGWPQSLRTTVSLCLASRFPILLWWGSEMVNIYNDGMAVILGGKDPRALGRPGRDVWPEIWDVVGPMLEGVVSRGEATLSEDQLLLLERKGFPEECYFTFAYSPIRDESGDVGGAFTPGFETTDRVIGERAVQHQPEHRSPGPDSCGNPNSDCRFVCVRGRDRGEITLGGMIG